MKKCIDLKEIAVHLFEEQHRKTSLDVLTERYLGYQLPKDKRKSDWHMHLDPQMAQCTHGFSRPPPHMFTHLIDATNDVDATWRLYIYFSAFQNFKTTERDLYAFDFNGEDMKAYFVDNETRRWRILGHGVKA